MGKETTEQLKEIIGLTGELSDILARTAGEGMKKMIKKRSGYKDVTA